MGGPLSLQKWVTERYLELNQNPTLKGISEDTGVQLTRAFRILNGASMRLSEYEIFRRRIQEKIPGKGALEDLVEECILKLPPKEIGDLISLLRKRLRINNFKLGK